MLCILVRFIRFALLLVFMKIHVFIERTNQRKKISVESLQEIFKKLNVDQNTVLVTRNSELLNGDETVYDGDEIKLLSVISGG